MKNTRLPEVRFAQDEQGRSIARGVGVGRGVRLGAHVVLHPKVRLGDGVVVMDGAVIGRVPVPTATTTRRVKSAYAPVEIGAGSVIGANAVLNVRYQTTSIAQGAAEIMAYGTAVVLE